MSARQRVVHAPRPLPQASYTEGGYASVMSVAQGATIDFHIATSVSPFALEIVNLKAPDTVLQTLTLQSAPLDCTGLSAHGCQWPVTSVFSVPADWPSGYYAARFPTTFGLRHIFFLVREDAPTSFSRMVVVVATNTYQAYNSFGYKSVYPSNSPERSYRVSYDRPFHDDRGLGRFARWDKPFLEWMTKENRRFEVIADTDLETPNILDPYRLVVIVGHSEYWTAAGRANLEHFVQTGGRVAILGGNTMWWQARLDERFMTVYKAAEPDPLNGVDNAHVTVNWYDEPVFNPENLITGSSFRNGGYTNRTGPPQYGYSVTDASHWALATTGAANGTQFGQVAAGEETDGALYNCTMNGLQVDGSDGTPLNFRILATVPAAEGHGTVGIYTTRTGGAVFNAGTQNWVLGLASDPIVMAMTRNVLTRFLQGPVPYEPVSSSARTRELFNCPLDTTEEKLMPGWRGEEGEGAITQRCASEGVAGFELTGTPRIFIVRTFAPTHNTIKHATAKFALNADASSGPGTAPLSLLTLQSRANDVISRKARVVYEAGSKSVRLELFNASNGVSTRSDWVKLASGWNELALAWRSPGAVTLRLQGQIVATLTNPLPDQTVGEVTITYDQPAMTGYLCMDALSVE
jgi:hypothetical protein